MQTTTIEETAQLAVEVTSEEEAEYGDQLASHVRETLGLRIILNTRTETEDGNVRFVVMS